MRLYRGLKNPYRPERVDDSRRSGTDFTDCPATAMLYAQSSRGVLVVVDVGGNEDDLPPRRVSKEFWLDREAQRFMLWGRFDDLITIVLSAKDLRMRLRREGVRNAALLRAVIDDELRLRALRSKLGSRSEFVDRVSSHE